MGSNSYIHTKSERVKDGKVIQDRKSVEKDGKVIQDRKSVEKDGTVIQDRKSVPKDGKVIQDRKSVQKDGKVIQDRKSVQKDGKVIQDRKSVQKNGKVIQNRKCVQDSKVIQDRKSVQKDGKVIQDRKSVQKDGKVIQDRKSFNPDLLNKKGTKCGPFTEKNRPTQEVQHLISSFWAGPRRIWDHKLIFYGPLYSGPFSEDRFRGGASDCAAVRQRDIYTKLQKEAHINKIRAVLELILLKQFKRSQSYHGTWNGKCLNNVRLIFT